jgi:formimidoylglutamate deiminase
MLPGLVNVHSHAFQRVIRGRTEHRTTAQRDTFWTWREAMYRAANQLSPEAMYHAARMAFLEMLLSGITTVGEFHYVHHSPGGVPYQVRNLLASEMLRAAGEIGLRIGLLRTAYVRAGWHKPPDPGQARFLTPRVEDFIADTEALRAALPRLSRPGLAWVGVAPHSVRAVPLDYLRELVTYARANQLPVHMHLAEQPAEVEACMAEYGLRPVELLHKHGILDSRFTGIHAIHITAEEAGYLGDARACVCACPTSERNLGDGAVPADQLLNRGAGICFGSDSNVQIDLLEDARLLEYHLRMNKLERVVLATDSSTDSLAQRLFNSATATGTRSLGAPGDSQCGALRQVLQRSHDRGICGRHLGSGAMLGGPAMTHGSKTIGITNPSFSRRP